MLMHHPSQALHFSQYVKIRKCSVCAEILSQVNTFSFRGHHLFPSRSPPSLTWAKSICDCTSSLLHIHIGGPILPHFTPTSCSCIALLKHSIFHNGSKYKNVVCVQKLCHRSPHFSSEVTTYFLPGHHHVWHEPSPFVIALLHIQMWAHPPSLHTHVMLVHHPSKALHFSQWVKIQKWSVCAETLSQVTTFPS